MKPPSFDYVAASSVDEALSHLGDPDSAVLAGGQSLVALMNARRLRPRTLVDINGVRELDGISVEDREVRLGALTRISDVEGHPDVARRVPALTEAAVRIAYPAVRNRGTVGGNIAFADPDGTMPVVMVALGAGITVSDGGERTIPAAEFFRGAHETALGTRELVTGVAVPVAEGTATAFEEICPRNRGWSLVNAAAAVVSDGDGGISDVRVVLGGVGDAPVALDGLQDALGDGSGPEDVAAAVRGAVERLPEPRADQRASAEYRRHLAGVVARRTLRRAIERAGRT